MASDQPNCLEHLDKELVFLIFRECFDSRDIHEYFPEGMKTIKIIRSINKKFSCFKKELIEILKSVAQERFLKESGGDQSEARMGKSVEKQQSATVTNLKLKHYHSLADIFVEVDEYIKKKSQFSEEVLELKAAQLILAGANTNQSVQYCNPIVNHPIKITILQFIARTGCFKKLVPILVAYGADINAQDAIDNTALHYAVNANHKDVVLSICECGGDVNIQGYQGDTALHSACKELLRAQQKASNDESKKLYLNIVEILKPYTKPTIKNKEGKSYNDILARINIY